MNVCKDSYLAMQTDQLSDILKTVSWICDSDGSELDEFLDSSSSSSSSDEYDDDEANICSAFLLIRKKQELVKKPRKLNLKREIPGYESEQFKSLFGVSQETFQFLIETIGPDLLRKVDGCPTIPSQQQLMIALWKMATLDSYKSVCDRFNVGKGTAHRALRRVITALHSLAPRFIRWPLGDRALEVMQGFKEISGFPRAIGVIDATHIRIEPPKDESYRYANKLGFNSIRLQLVCDHKNLITHCSAGLPGSVSDQEVLEQTEIGAYLNDDHMFPNNSHLLGNSSYALHRHLLTPYKDNGFLTETQKNYNDRLLSARAVADKVINLMKGRLPSLLFTLPMTRVDLMPQYVIACCVIHNICTLRGDENGLVLSDFEEPSEEDILVLDDVKCKEESAAPFSKRNTIAESLGEA